MGIPFKPSPNVLAYAQININKDGRAQEKAIAALRASAKRLATWGKVYDNEKLARKAKSMEKRVEKMEDSRTFVSPGSRLHLSLGVEKSRANRMLQMAGLDIKVPNADLSLFHIEDFYIRPGDRMALLGHNGVGKTTFIRKILNDYDAHVSGATSPCLRLSRFNGRALERSAAPESHA